MSLKTSPPFHPTLLQKLCSRLLQHELHAKLFLYQPLLSLTTGLLPLPTDPWRYASRFPHLWHNCCLSFSLSLGVRVFHSTTRDLMRLALLVELLRNFIHCWIRWHGIMIWKIFLFDIPAFLIESSRYVSNTMWLLTPSCRMWVSAESACWENGWSLPFIFSTRLMPSVMVTEGSGVVSAGKNWLCLARAALLIFHTVQSPLKRAQGNDPSVRERTSLILRWRFSPTRTTWANRVLPACRVILFQLLAEVFFRISENDLEQQPLLHHRTGPLVFCLQAGLTWIPRMIQCHFFLAIKNVPCYIWRG